MIHVLNGAFAGATTECQSAADANDDGVIDIGDPITMLETLFGDLSGLPTPYPSCGAELIEDDLSCGGSSCE